MVAATTLLCRDEETTAAPGTSDRPSPRPSPARAGEGECRREVLFSRPMSRQPSKRIADRQKSCYCESWLYQNQRFAFVGRSGKNSRMKSNPPLSRRKPLKTLKIAKGIFVKACVYPERFASIRKNGCPSGKSRRPVVRACDRAPHPPILTECRPST